MDANELRAAAEYFDGREHETLDRGRVTRNLRLMVSHILATVPADDAEPVTVDSLRQQLADVKHSLDWLVGSLALIHGLDVADATPESVFQSCEDVTEERDRLRAELLTARAGLMAVESLIEESQGVYGLHLNGYPAPWSEIRGDGRYCEWLEDYDAAVLAAVAATNGENDVK